MLVHRSLEGLSIQKSVVTTGSFDGVHVGHKTILSRLKAIAAENGGTSVLVTFYPHPRKVLYPNTQGKDLQMINTQREKIRLLEKAGLDHLVIIPFTLEFSKTSSVDFIRKILVGKLHASTVVVGFNHHFGHNREGNYEYLYELGKYYNFRVEEIPEQDIHNETVSSTKIRKALFEGNIQRANAYLDHEYFMIGPVLSTEDLNVSNSIQWYSVLAEEAEKQLPPPGIYAGSVSHGIDREKVMIRISGDNPKNCVHVHFLNQGYRVPPEVFLNFHKKIRGGQETGDPVSDALLSESLIEIDELIY